MDSSITSTPNDQRDESREDGVSRNVVILQHPDGGKVYLVATAHISAQSQQDVIDTIEKVGPGVVVLELDQERLRRLKEASYSGDRFGFQRYKHTGSLKIASMALSGDLLPYASGLFYVAIGALMGTRPGGEFLAAAEAAERSGAAVVLGDRDQHVTMRRLQWYTRQLVQGSRGANSGRPDGLHFPEGNDMPGALPDILQTHRSASIEDDTYPNKGMGSLNRNGGVGGVGGDGGPWGLGQEEEDESESAMKARLLRMMKDGGCPQPNAVLAAAQRLLKAGLDPKGSIDARDVLEVRSCGTTLVENFRQHALQGDDDWMRSLEIEPLAGAKGALGAQRSRQAMQRVIIEERDAILARKLWEAGRQAGQQGVVGVVGAGHVGGIQRLWDIAGSPELESDVQEYMKLPRGEGPPSATGLAITGGVLGYIAWRRPKAAGLMLGFMTLATAPYLGFSVFTMRRFTSFAGKLAEVCQQVDSADVDMVPGGWSGGIGSPEGEWQ